MVALSMSVASVDRHGWDQYMYTRIFEYYHKRVSDDETLALPGASDASLSRRRHLCVRRIRVKVYTRVGLTGERDGDGPHELAAATREPPQQTCDPRGWAPNRKRRFAR